MGIQGLLPFLSKATRPVNVRNFSGCTVAVDAYCWLHKGAFSCADKLGKGEKTDGYVHFCVKMVNVLLDANVTPILVFDGRQLKSKAVTDLKRKENKRINKQKAKEQLLSGNIQGARECFQRSVEITSQMAHEAIQACRKLGVDCIVAPYEADAQLAYLNKIGIAQVIISEDSDLVLFGSDRILYKMDINGNGILLEKNSIHKCLGQRTEKFSFEKFRYMCILSGCDYLPSLPGIGLGKACKFFAKVTNPDLTVVLPKLPFYLKMPNLTVTTEYVAGFIRADNTFLYQLVFDPIQRKLVPLNPYRDDVDPAELDYAGTPMTDDVAYQLAIGNVDVDTMKPVPDLYDPESAEPKSRSWSASRRVSIFSPKYEVGCCKSRDRQEVAAVIETGPVTTPVSRKFQKRIRAELKPEDDDFLSVNDIEAQYGQTKKVKCEVEVTGVAPAAPVVRCSYFQHVDDDQRSPKGTLLFDQAVSSHSDIPKVSPQSKGTFSAGRWQSLRSLFAHKSAADNINQIYSKSPTGHTSFKPVLKSSDSPASTTAVTTDDEDVRTTEFVNSFSEDLPISSLSGTSSIDDSKSDEVETSSPTSEILQPLSLNCVTSDGAVVVDGGLLPEARKSRLSLSRKSGSQQLSLKETLARFSFHQQTSKTNVCH